MAKYKITRHPVFKDFGLVTTLNGLYICPGWIPVDEGTTRDDIEFSDDITVNKNKQPLKSPEIAQKDLEFKVPSSNGKSEYLVTFKRGQWNCNCPASSFRRGHCKHIKALETIQDNQI
jgi:hypothetical protein